MLSVKQKSHKKLIIVLSSVGVLLFSILLGIQKVLYLSGEPQGDKNCPPVNPEDTKSENNPNIIEVLGPYGKLKWEQKGGIINDASCLNATAIYGMIEVKEEADIHKAITFAKQNGLKIAIAGIRHSMGGQAVSRNAVVLDMRSFNKKTLNEETKILTVQSGATWHDIQKFLHPKYAVKAMQSTDIFTVGGSISVNAHGMDHQIGSIHNTIRALRIMHPSGEIEEVSPTKNPELFKLVIGGYGLFGIILDADIEVTDNTIYETSRKIINYTEFTDYFNSQIANNTDYGLMYSHLSTAPGSFLKEMILYTYKTDPGPHSEIPPLREVSNERLRRFVINLAKSGSIAQSIKWFVEKNIEPKLETCTITRNQALKEGESCLVSRNEPMHDSVRYLKNSLKNDTDILQEYFIPRSEFKSFVDNMRAVLQKNNARVLNASVRVVKTDDIYLSYAPQDSYSIVLYLNQTTNDSGNAKMKKLTEDLIDVTLLHKGRFFLPYQLYYSKQQLQGAYPQINDFFKLKEKYDPERLLTNKFYEKYR